MYVTTGLFVQFEIYAVWEPNAASEHCTRQDLNSTIAPNTHHAPVFEVGVFLPAACSSSDRFQVKATATLLSPCFIFFKSQEQNSANDTEVCAPSWLFTIYFNFFFSCMLCKVIRRTSPKPQKKSETIKLEIFKNGKMAGGRGGGDVRSFRWLVFSVNTMPQQAILENRKLNLKPHTHCFKNMWAVPWMST